MILLLAAGRGQATPVIRLHHDDGVVCEHRVVELCRTVLVGQVSEEVTSATTAYARAQEAGIASATPGAPLLGVDAAMASTLERAGYGGAFLRPVFHGVGIEHEEAPIPGGHAVIHGEEKVEQVETGMVLA